jgi:hypothetical protein
MAGSGTYVTNTEGHVSVDAGYVGGRNLLIEKYDQTLEYVNAQQTALDAYLDDYQNLIDEFDLPNGWEDLLGDVIISDVPQLDLGSRPTLGSITLNDNWPTTFPIAPLLDVAPAFDLSYTEPTAPTDVNPTIDYVNGAFNSDLYADLSAAILDDIRNGGDGWGGTAEQAVYDRAISRNRLANEAEYLKGRNHIANVGAAMPGGAKIALLYRMQERVGVQETDINNDILTSQAKLVWDANQSAQERAVNLEQLLRTFYDGQENRTLDADKAAADLILRVYAERWGGFIANWEGIKVGLEAQSARISVVIQNNQLLIDKYKTEWDGFQSQTEAIASENESKTRGLEAESRAYAAESAAYATWYNALSEQQKTLLEKSRLDLEKASAELKATIDSTVSLSALKQEALNAQANITSQAVASGMNAVNTSVSHGTSGNESVSERFDHGDSISETHSFSET